MHAGDDFPLMIPQGFGRRSRNAKRAAAWRTKCDGSVIAADGCVLPLQVNNGADGVVLPLQINNEGTQLKAMIMAMENRIAAQISALGNKIDESTLASKRARPTTPTSPRSASIPWTPSPHKKSGPKDGAGATGRARVRFSEASTRAPSSPTPSSAPSDECGPPSSNFAFRRGAADFIPGAQEHEVIATVGLTTSLLGAAPWKAAVLLNAGYAPRAPKDARIAIEGSDASAKAGVQISPTPPPSVRAAPSSPATSPSGYAPRAPKGARITIEASSLSLPECEGGRADFAPDDTAGSAEVPAVTIGRPQCPYTIARDVVRQQALVAYQEVNVAGIPFHYDERDTIGCRKHGLIENCEECGFAMPDCDMQQCTSDDQPVYRCILCAKFVCEDCFCFHSQDHFREPLGDLDVDVGDLSGRWDELFSSDDALWYKDRSMTNIYGAMLDICQGCKTCDAM